MAQVRNAISTRLRVPVDLDDINNNNHHIGLRSKRPRPASTTSSNKPKAQKVKGKRGALKCLLQMPDDIMWEVTKLLFTFSLSWLLNDVTIQVFQHLGPYDLLRLARTTRGLRRFLLSPTTAPLWRTSRANVPGLPDCPQDLSEPHYAYLMFELICHVRLLLNT